jgi:D-glycero-D-manno-heptose 1,7-bisphosphate phosphatase
MILKLLTPTSLWMPYLNNMSERAVFLDRDGTIVNELEFIRYPRQVKILPGVISALKQLQQAGFKLIVVTNQSCIARGWVTLKELKAIHSHIEKLLQKHGILLDKIYYCPHHRDGVLKRYSFECGCRKPATGLFKQAAKKFKIRLSQSFMIGDTRRDIEAGHRIKAKSILVLTGQGKKTLKDKRVDKKVQPDFIARNLLSAVPFIIGETITKPRMRRI